MKSPALILAAALFAPALALGEDPPASIDISELPGTIVADVVIPVPREVFLSLDKLGDQDWKSQILKSEFDKLGDREQVALLFGVVVADGFVAVQAESRESVTDIGRHVSRLAKALGVADTVNAHAAAIIESAEKDDWDGVRSELDRVQQSVREKMRSMRDEDLAHMVSTGGWLRGTAATSALIKSSYTKERAEILHQPDLAEHIINRLVATSKSALTRRLAQDIGELSPLLSLDGDIPEYGVEKIQTVSAKLIQLIIEDSE